MEILEYFGLDALEVSDLGRVRRKRILSPEIKSKKPKAPYRKPKSVKVLESMKFEADKLKSSMPEKWIAKTTFRDDTANGLTKCIVQYITLCGGFASRLNNTGLYDARLKRYRPGGSKKGLPDILSTYKGQSLFIEVKIGHDRQSDAQIKIEHEQQKSGGHYFLARNFTDFKNWFDKI
jgi:hypothetical protein